MAAPTVRLKDGRLVRLGRRRLIARPQALNLANYFDPAKMTTPPPASVDYSQKAMDAIKRMYLNDTYGDCVIASKYHQVGIWTGNESGTAVQGTDTEVYNSYQTICGAGDNGCVITDVLDYFRQTGLQFNGVNHKIDGYVQADWTNKLMVQVALLVFGGGCIGINLPGDWTCTNCTWDTTNSQIVGGHDVCLVGYNATGVQICTWAGIVTITWAAFNSTQWLEELYFELSPDWYAQNNTAPNGIDMKTLQADLAAINGGNIPPINPPSPPTPPAVIPYKLFEGPKLVGSVTGYNTLTSAETDAHNFANTDKVAVVIEDNTGTVVETVQPNTPPTPPNPPNPPTPTTGWSGNLNISFLNGVIENVTATSSHAFGSGDCGCN